MTWPQLPQLLQVDPRREFMRSMTKGMENHKHIFALGAHRDQAIVECFNQTLAERLFDQSVWRRDAAAFVPASTAWVKRLADVVKALNNYATRLTVKKTAAAKPSTPYARPVGANVKRYPPTPMFAISTTPANLKLEVKDPIWSLKVYMLEKAMTKANEPVLYYLHNGPKRRFVREELLVLPPNTQLPPTYVVFETVYPSKGSINFVINQALSCLAIHGDISVSVPHIKGSVHVGFRLFHDDLISIKPPGKRPSDIPASSSPFLAEFHPRKRESSSAAPFWKF